MCSGGDDVTSCNMDDPLANEMPIASHSQDDIHSEIAGSLFELTSHPKDYMMKFVCDANGEQLPILSEYFSVALTFAALGGLIRGKKGTPHLELNPKFQRVGLQVMLKNAMDRLQLLALNAQELEKKVIDGKEGTRKDAEAWDAERRTLVQRLSLAEAQIESVKKCRHEDAKANEKVVGIFASHEQAWINEKKKLKREIELLRNEIVVIRKRNVRKVDEGKGCEECRLKVQELEKLEDKLCEKEFLLAAASDEARSDQRERNQLAGKLAMMESCVSNLKEKISKETAKNRELQAVIADISDKHEEAERMLKCATADLASMTGEVKSMSEANVKKNVMVEELSDDLLKLQKDIDDKEEVISVILKKSDIDRKEREDLLLELAHVKSKRKAAEYEKDRWKRLAEERARTCSSGSNALKSRRSLGSKTELDKLSEIRRSCDEEVHGLKSMYMTKLEALQEQLNSYEEKVALLESKIVVHSVVNQKRKPKQEVPNLACVNAKECDNRYDLVTLLESVAPEVDMMLFKRFNPEIQEVPVTAASLKDWLEQWLEAVKSHHAQHLEQRHWREIDAFERQMRLKDERVESFRWQLLSMESECSKLKSELEMLKSRLAIAVDEKCRAERAVEVKDTELRALMKTVLPNCEDLSFPDSCLEKLSPQEAQQKVLVLLHKELNDAKKKLEEAEVKHRKNLLKVSEDCEAEIRQKDHHLAVVEARLCQLIIQSHNDKRFRPDGASNGLPGETVPEKVYKVAVARAQEMDVKNAISSACIEVEKLAEKVSEVRKQMMESNDNYTSLEELCHQATAVSNSGKKLSLLKNAISIKGLDDTRATLFNDYQPTILHLEPIRLASQNLSSSNSLVPAADQVFLDQPQFPVDEASTSGAPEAEVSDDYISLDTEAEITSKRNPSDGGMILLESNSDVVKITDSGEVTDVGVLMGRAVSSSKTDRRKTLKEFFLDSPPELAVENIFQVPPSNMNSKKIISRFSSQSVLQVEKNTLSEISPQQRNPGIDVTNLSQRAAPNFDKIKRRSKEFKKSREDTHVLGLALELQNIEAQILQIDKRNDIGQLAVNFNSNAESMPKITPSKRINKRYAALTGKVGFLAKQMGLTSEKSPDIVTDNPLYNRRPTAVEIHNLQQRAEAVFQSLASFETQEDVNPVDESASHQIGYSEEHLVDTVNAHLSLIQRSLRSKVEPFIAHQQSTHPTTTSLEERL
ncbi:uncharacterized protein [Physcomitrium patens]|uniref:Uncharacterized protein n=1 Tax=Physcomitrium patens TaxID=3218 RepID=A0A2K1JG10_PHYPA|nr:myosin-7-like isoform X1 [Physcomitrium patens]XP_024393566.1 myosin-7-like isoform X1 [Physcomitrium patens]XP_024393567.1 myosin-7-like isoform X1 [Physcomitrium patens]XP_024393568.1 myosin-7-like isoform X1 [Physcomitrium patens]XP_024393569.1 myosin-7-like isoform X1 [Physcomitrium patens]XP_024393570.1 myosin-7-like isoform X1 [Physcomitrium patens]XP_024393571.1 myosin-7-like isoform X1 [Physcomitrium patens]XP_024393572.1 myosin-7-like isoform X1 [Physcomitrium patens]PNR40475.1 |eukprot:XP_024393565.1 myosin-7-like isoform X1 [Physcomitrella patens]